VLQVLHQKKNSLATILILCKSNEESIRLMAETARASATAAQTRMKAQRWQEVAKIPSNKESIISNSEK